MKILDFFKALFSKFVRIFKRFIKDAIPLTKQIVIGQLRDIALEAVSELSETDFSNEEKRRQAFERISNYARSSGIQVRDHIISMLIELALSKIKGA